MIRHNRLIATVLSAALILSAAPVGAAAAEEPALSQGETEMEEDVASVSEDAEVNDVKEEDSSVPEETGSDQADAAISEDDSEEKAVIVVSENSAADEENAALSVADEKEEAEPANEPENSAAEPSESGNPTVVQADNSAEEQVVSMQGDDPEMVFVGEATVDPEEQYEEFLKVAFYGKSAADRSGVQSPGRTGKNLTGLDALVYNKLAEAAREIVAGERDTGVVEIPITEITGGKTEFTAKELGLEYIYTDALGWNPGIDQALADKFFVDFAKVQSCLRADCAYEMYPLESGFSYPLYPEWYAYGARGYGDDYVLTLSQPLVVAWSPISRFAAESDTDKYAIDSAKIRDVLYAADNAKRIVSNAAGMSDYYKLSYYKEKICDLVSYDDEARKQGFDYEDRGAWALLNVFDGHENTNVVCEGYSEAFQYLCELTDFDDDTYAYSVTGTMAGGKGAGGHKWNIVHIGGANYIADITNSDSGTVGDDGKLFLKGMTGGVDEGYTKEWPEREEVTDLGDGRYSDTTYPGGTISYKYDAETKSVYSEEELTLSETDYGTTAQKSADDLAMIKGVQVHLTDKVGLIIYVKPVNGYALSEDDFMKFTCNNESKEIKVGDPECRKHTITDYTGEEIEVYAFEYDLWTKNMADKVSFCVNIDGQSGSEKTYSVKEYAEEILRGSWYGNYSDKEKRLARALLNLGGYAQEYFGYNTENCANDGIDKELGDDPDLSGYKYTLAKADDTQGFTIKQATLLFGTYISLIYTFDLDEGKTINDYDVLINGKDISAYGDSETETAMVSYNEELKSQCVVIKNIKTSDWDKSYHLEVKPKGQPESICTLNYGPFSYCYSKISKGNEKIKKLCKAIYNYWYELNQG